MIIGAGRFPRVLPKAHTTKYSPFETPLRGRFIFSVKLLCFDEKIELALVFFGEKCYYNNV